MRRAVLLLLFTSGLAAPAAARRCSAGDACWPADADLRGVGASLAGDVLLPGDKAWGAAIKLKNPRISDLVPGAVAMAKSADDVSAVMAFVAKRNLTFSVKSTGHCYNGNCMGPGSLHLDLTQMNAVSVDAAEMEMRAQPGATFKAMYDAATGAGVQVAGGMCPTVAPVGFSLGGGHGPMSRSLGLGADNILSAEVVTANATHVTANASANSDLFWALRGGGGGAFGVVVELKIRVHPAPPQMVSLSMAWPLKQGGASVGEPVLTEWYDSIMPQLPEQWQFYTIAMKKPLGVPGVSWKKGEMDGLLVLEGLYNGPWSQNMLDPVGGLLRLGKDVQIKSAFANFSTFSDWHNQVWFASEGPIAYRTYMASSFAQPGFNASSNAALVSDTAVGLGQNEVNMMFGVQLGGRVSSPGASTAISADFRSAVMMQENDADWTNLFGNKDAKMIDWARGVGDAVAAQAGFRGAYQNEADPAKARGTYETLFWRDTFDELQRIKRRWDPTDTFDCHQCVHS